MMIHCDKCWKDDEEEVQATHHCSECNMNMCENHLGLHNNSNKTRSHTSHVKEISLLPPKVEISIKYCDKCLKDEEEEVIATHSCPTCSMNFCENHINLHNNSNKTKSHASSVVEIPALKNSCDCAKCLKEHGESIAAGYWCEQCKVNLCENHFKLHNKSTKTSSHTHKVLTTVARNVPFSLEYEDEKKLGENEDFNFEFTGPNAICLDSKHGKLFVSDRSTIFEFDTKTKLMVNHFKEPQDRDHYHTCYDLRDDALVYVIDRCCASTIVKISRDGKMTYWENDEDMGIIRSMAVDKHDGTIYLLQRGGIDFLCPDTGKVIKSLRENLQGQNLFGNTDFASLALNSNNDLVLLSEYEMIVCNKKGKILKKVEVKTPCGRTGRLVIENETGRIFTTQYGIVSMNQEGQEWVDYNNEFFDVSTSGKGIDIALDCENGELYCSSRSKTCVLSFK